MPPSLFKYQCLSTFYTQFACIVINGKLLYIATGGHVWGNYTFYTFCCMDQSISWKCLEPTLQFYITCFCIKEKYKSYLVCSLKCPLKKEFRNHANSKNFRYSCNKDTQWKTCLHRSLKICLFLAVEIHAISW